MARYTGPKTKIARKFGAPIYGSDKNFEKKNYPPGQHGISKKRRKISEYGVQLLEKQKAKYTYGILERQFRRMFDIASKMKGKTGENLLKIVESRLDNVVYRLSISPSRAGSRQLITHRHILVNGNVVNVPSFLLRPGDIISVREKSKSLEVIQDTVRSHGSRYPWIEWDENLLSGKFMAYPERESIPESINEQLIVELYSK
jgi:small subunit ribosomal protein S4